MEDKFMPESLKGQEENKTLYELDNDAPVWHTGQSYQKEPAKQIKCAICGNDKFYVAEGVYWVGIKCIVCEYEICVSDG